jgi:hypothetical protein
VFEAHRRTRWPEQNSVVVDHLGFRISAWNPDGTPKTGPVAFNVFGAMSYGGGYARLWKLEAFVDAKPASWHAFFGSLDGEPRRVVSDGHSGTISAAKKLWPAAELYRSEWHLRQAIYDELVASKQHGDTRLHAALKQAFVNAYFWEHFTVIAYRDGSTKLNKSIKRCEPLVLEQFARRPPKERRRANPITIGGIENKLRPIKAWIAPRADGFKNRARLNRLLMLMQMQLNGEANEDAYTIAIREFLLANNGHVPSRRLITDVFGQPSLRKPDLHWA